MNMCLWVSVERSKCNKRNRRLVESINEGSSFEFTVAFAITCLRTSHHNQIVLWLKENFFTYVHKRTRRRWVECTSTKHLTHIQWHSVPLARQNAHIWMIWLVMTFNMPRFCQPSCICLKSFFLFIIWRNNNNYIWGKFHLSM